MKRGCFSVAEIGRARRLLGLGEQASLGEIKAAYRHLCKRWHPDTHADEAGSSEKIREINAAYRLLLDYCESYRFSFVPEEIASFDPEQWWYHRFGENIRSPQSEEEGEQTPNSKK